jgi:hypothetical protein
MEGISTNGTHIGYWWESQKVRPRRRCVDNIKIERRSGGINLARGR